ncbi:hypothetical protein [Thioalbus denitrificans]|uniref:Lipoprotein n=1 Tax=Thioalbus denitrificans TaxID=547122 RepID=A0A369C0D4_9GAMM|nr:hypothetical protein [Thioalbus denitrificans]RCX26508.1 hypothetical protein DFQ59_10937 [Thioalbus denitrificans]
MDMGKGHSYLSLGGLVLVALLFLSGCATTRNVYVFPDAAASGTATIISSWTRNGLTDWEGYSIESIDGKYVSYGMSDRDWVTIPITAGVHQLVVFGQFNRTFGGSCPCQTYAELTFEAESGVNYKLLGEVKGVNINFWVIDKETGEVKSDVSGASYARSPQDSYVPIYIPM